MGKELTFDVSELSVVVTCEACKVSVSVGASSIPRDLKCPAGCERHPDGDWLGPLRSFVDAATKRNIRLRAPLD